MATEAGHDTPGEFVETEEALREELATYAHRLRNVLAPWEQRVQGLLWVEQLARRERDERRFPSFASHIHEYLCAPLIAQVLDKRSAVVKQACLTISAVSRCLGNEFVLLLDDVLAALFRNVIVTVKVVAESSHICAVQILGDNDDVAVTLRRLADEVCGKHKVLRARCAEYVQLIMKKRHRTHLVPYEKELGHLLVTELNDGDGSVRLTARQTFWEFARHFPNHAHEVLMCLENHALAKQIVIDGESMGRRVDDLLVCLSSRRPSEAVVGPGVTFLEPTSTRERRMSSLSQVHVPRFSKADSTLVMGPGLIVPVLTPEVRRTSGEFACVDDSGRRQRDRGGETLNRCPEETAPSPQ